jgi:hypothetical protein
VVEHRIESPEAVPIEEAPVGVEPRQGPCLVCGSWVDGDEDFEVVVRGRGGSIVHAVHRTCLAGVARAEAALP